MTWDWKRDLQEDQQSATANLPPALLEETGWDILLALHADPACALSLQKLASLVSASERVMSQWLPALEQRRLVTGVPNQATGELRAALTQTGRQLLDRYLAVTTRLQVAAHH